MGYNFSYITPFFAIFAMMNSAKTIEIHPLQPFVPDGARLLMLGSFPPKRERWSMEFFYPNRQNDMWRVMGLLFADDKTHFEEPSGRGFDRERIVDFCNDIGLAIYDAATEVRRLKDNASDQFLEIVKPTNIEELLHQMPLCRAIVATGQKAAETVAAQLGCDVPSVGGSVDVTVGGRELHFWRMPSTSRAYPLSLERKAAAYRAMFEKEGCL